MAFCVPLALRPSLFWLGSSFSPVSGFQFLVFRVFRWSSTGFFFRAPLLSFLPLGCSCLVGVLCVPCSSLLYILLVTLSFSVFKCSFFLLYRFPVLFLVLPFVSLVSFLFFSCLVFLFCVLTSGPPVVSPVTTSSSAGHPTSFSSAFLFGGGGGGGGLPLALRRFVA